MDIHKQIETLLDDYPNEKNIFPDIDRGRIYSFVILWRKITKDTKFNIYLNKLEKYLLY